MRKVQNTWSKRWWRATAVVAATAAVGALTVTGGTLPASGATLSHTSATTTARDTSYLAAQSSKYGSTYPGAPLFRPNNSLAAILPTGDVVLVTCWYYGNSSGYAGDGYEDHVVWVSSIGNFTGHIPDDYVHIGGIPPAVGIPECG